MIEAVTRYKVGHLEFATREEAERVEAYNGRYNRMVGTHWRYGGEVYTVSFYSASEAKFILNTFDCSGLRGVPEERFLANAVQVERVVTWHEVKT